MRDYQQMMGLCDLSCDFHWDLVGELMKRHNFSSQAPLENTRKRRENKVLEKLLPSILRPFRAPLGVGLPVLGWEITAGLG